MLPLPLHLLQPVLKAEPLGEAVRGEPEVRTGPCTPVLATDLYFTLPDKPLQPCLVHSLHIGSVSFLKEHKVDKQPPPSPPAMASLRGSLPYRRTPLCIRSSLSFKFPLHDWLQARFLGCLYCGVTRQ